MVPVWHCVQARAFSPGAAVACDGGPKLCAKHGIAAVLKTKKKK